MFDNYNYLTHHKYTWVKCADKIVITMSFIGLCSNVN